MFTHRQRSQSSVQDCDTRVLSDDLVYEIDDKKVSYLAILLKSILKNVICVDLWKNVV